MVLAFRAGWRPITVLPAPRATARQGIPRKVPCSGSAGRKFRRQMSRARRRWTFIATIFTLSVTLVPGTAAGSSAPRNHWAVEIGSTWSSRLSSKQLQDLHRSGIDTVVLSRGNFAPATLARTETMAQSAGMVVVEPTSVSNPTPSAVRRALQGCDTADTPRLRTCAVRTSSLSEALAVAARPGLDAVVLDLASLRPVAGAALHALRSPLLLLAPGSTAGSTTAH